MAAGFASAPVTDFHRGVYASANRFTLPPGSVLRSSNLVLTTRGALTTIDGDHVLYSNVPTGAGFQTLQLIQWAPTNLANAHRLVVLVWEGGGNIALWDTLGAVNLATVASASLTANMVQAQDQLVVAPGLNQLLQVYTTAGGIKAITNPSFGSTGGGGLNYPAWQASTSYSSGATIGVVFNGVTNIFVVAQSGTSGTTQPNFAQFAATKGSRIRDGTSLVWLNNGTATSGSGGSTAVNPPPGAQYVFYHEGFYWIWGTAPTYLSDNINGPTTLWQSGIGNVNYWDPQFTAFIGQGDGQQNMGGAVFTQAEAGILSTNQLVLFKNADTYQIVGAFPTSASIIKVPTGVGCAAPGTIRFVPGMGIMRLCQFGVALFDGQNDNVDAYTDPIRPYLFGGISDIVAVDWNNISNASATIVANPPGYLLLCPLTGGNGTNVRGFFYDRLLGAWTIQDFPFSLGPGYFYSGDTGGGAADAVLGRTMIGGFNDGNVRQFFAGDTTWDTGAVTWSFRTPPVGSPGTPIFYRRLNLRLASAAKQNILASAFFNSTYRSGQQFRTGVSVAGNINPALGATVSLDIGVKALGGAFLDVSGTGPVTIEGLELEYVPQPSGRIGFS